MEEWHCLNYLNQMESRVLEKFRGKANGIVVQLSGILIQAIKLILRQRYAIFCRYTEEIENESRAIVL